MVQPLHITNANIWKHDNTKKNDLYCTDVILEQPAPNSLVVDLDGLTIYPGLINAHDHLELNHYPRTKFREVYNNAHEWGEDVDKRLDTEPYKSLREYPIWDRLFIGGLKNLLCGATTVAHHGPKYREMYRDDFPVHVLKDYGWSHSLHFDTEEDIVKSYQSTPKDHLWFIHLAEGTDDVAKSEYQRLKALGCVDENTVIVHGVGMTQEDVEDAVDIVRGLVWCPTTNDYLLRSKPQHLEIWVMHNKLAIGSDSRLTASNDLLSESIQVMKIPWNIVDNYPKNIESIFLNKTANMIRISQAGNLLTGNVTDFVIGSLYNRSRIQAIIKGGIPQIGDPDIMAKFSHIETVSALLDGVPKSINIGLARQIQKCKLKESGLDLLETPPKRFWIF